MLSQSNYSLLKKILDSEEYSLTLVAFAFQLQKLFIIWMVKMLEIAFTAFGHFKILNGISFYLKLSIVILVLLKTF